MNESVAIVDLVLAVVAFFGIGVLLSALVTAVDRRPLRDPLETPYCRYCGCSEHRACRLPTGPCAWVIVTDSDLARDEGVCSNRECLEQYVAEFPDVERLLVREPS